MDIRPRKNVHQFPKDILKEIKRLLTWSHNIIELIVNAPGNGRFHIPVALSPKLGISGQNGHTMPRKVNLRNNGNIPLRRILHNLLHLLHGIIAAISGRIHTGTGIQSNNGTVPVRTHLIKARVLAALNPPALVVGKVPMEIIQLMERQIINVPLHKLHRHKMSRNIQMHTPVFKRRRILNPHRRNCNLLPDNLPCNLPVCLPCNLPICLFCTLSVAIPPAAGRIRYRQQLQQGLHPIEQPGLILPYHSNLSGKNLKGICPLNCGRVLFYPQFNLAGTPLARGYPIMLLQIVLKESC